MDYKTIVNLMKEMSHTELTKLEIEEEGFRICIEKGKKEEGDQANIPQLTWNQNTMPAMPQYIQGMVAPGQMISPAPVMPGTVQNTTVNVADGANSTVASTSAAQTEGKKNQDTSGEDQNHKKLVSPMVGTFYAQPSPDKPPFVKVGDKVKKGQTLCIIEAMKLMNEIESEYDGEIVKILTKNEDMVEFGQPLFLIKQ
jgi:acetyl-CoA carboxylase biotin carboxyl carrier protein